MCAFAVHTLVLGPAQTNTYIIADEDTREAVVIDPAWDGKTILETARGYGWRVAHIWLTHAHFDHLAGAGELADGIDPPPPVCLHPDDHSLWKNQGGAALFGMKIDPGPEPTIDLYQGQILHLGKLDFEVRHTPGHTRGPVVFYCAAEKAVFCGDLIFRESIGRTDMPGGDYDTLIHSIRTQILTLPDDTALLPGHGPDTTVGTERKFNPFLQE